MTLEIDHFLKIGKTHDICEDYIISGYNPCPYVILADGCSSSKNTDIGARVIAQVAKRFLIALTQYTYRDNNNIGKFIALEAEKIIKPIGINQTCLDATLIIMYELDGYVNIIAFGDGYIIIKYNTGLVIHKKIEYSNSMPFYINYYNDAKRKATYKEHNIEKIISTNSFNSLPAVGIEDVVDHTYKFQVCKCFELQMNNNNNNIESILIASDGLGSFPVINPNEQVIMSELIAFKTTKGRFVKRRTKKFIEKQEKQRIFHTDDISIGGFHYNND